MVPLLERPFDRLPRGRPVEVVDAEQVREEARDAGLEAVEPRERVFANREDEVGRRPPLSQRERQLLLEGVRAFIVRVVEEVVLELVEDDQHRAADPRRPLGEDVREPTGRRAQGERADALDGLLDASSRAATGRSLLHDENGTATARGSLAWPGSTPPASELLMTPAFRTELLPTPLAP